MAARMNAYLAQKRSLRYLFLRHLCFRLQHRFWFSFRRRRPLVVDFEINTDGQRIGLFAELVWLLYAIRYAEAIGAHPVIRLTSAIYSRAGDGQTDYLPQLFDPVWSGADRPGAWVIRKRISSLAHLPCLALRTQGLNLWVANQIVTRYLPVNSRIQSTVEDFVRSRLGNDYIAVHWRGTDKHLEAKPVTSSDLAEKIMCLYQAMPQKPRYLFIASDQEDHLASLAAEVSRLIPGLRCVARDCVQRSADGNPVHLRRGLEPDQRDQMGREALIDCLIMARARALIRTASYLSAWCSIWNPLLPVFMVNQPHEATCWFPDDEILLASRFRWARLQSQGLLLA